MQLVELVKKSPIKTFIIAVIVLLLYKFYIKKDYLRGIKKDRQIIYFSNSDCQWCKIVDPIWQKFVDRHKIDNKIQLIKSSDQQNTGLMNKYYIQYYPQIIGVKNDIKITEMSSKKTLNNLESFYRQIESL